MATPATLVVILAVAMLIFAGWALIFTGRSDNAASREVGGERSRPRRCHAPGCGRENAAKAKFCGACGAALNHNDDEGTNHAND